ncbi:MAG TPA: hypothetical protein VK636_18620 [Gemmatimonadaceae bacterium]|nr:hypothetical protein [Gemmatimonadaceae bacterium]
MSSSRRLLGGIIRLALVVLAVVFVGRYFMRHSPGRNHVRVQTEVPPPEALGPGDVHIYSADTSVDLILQGDKILAGLSPQTVAKVKISIDSSASGDTSGLGGSISQIVKKSVAGAIGTHAVFPLADIRDIRYESGQIVFDWKDGGKHQLFGNTKVNGNKVSNSFRPDDAQRFIDAVKARMEAK